MFHRGGVKGAIGLSLGLFLVADPAIERLIRVRMMFFISGVSAMTLLINGITSIPLIRALRLSRPVSIGKAAHTFYFQAVKILNDHAFETMMELHRSHRFAGAKWTHVWRNVEAIHAAMQRAFQQQSGDAVHSTFKNPTR
jgi:hypothetical protein